MIRNDLTQKYKDIISEGECQTVQFGLNPIEWTRCFTEDTGLLYVPYMYIHNLICYVVIKYLPQN